MSRSQEHPEVVDLSHQKGGVTTDQEGKAGSAWEKTRSSAWDMLRCLSDPHVGVDTAAGWKGFKGEVRARMAVWVGNALKICHSHRCGQRRGCGLSGVLCGDHGEPLRGMSILCVGDTGPSLN